jgi:hypothetical protein
MDDLTRYTDFACKVKLPPRAHPHGFGTDEFIPLRVWHTFVVASVTRA